MSETDLPIRFADSAQEALDASKTAGRLLREAREAQGLHVAALAVSLKVAVKKLEALEADQWEEFADAVFIRALAASVCRSLKIDAAPILDKLPKLNKRVLDQVDSGVNVAFRPRNEGAAPAALSKLSAPVVWGVLALLLAALVLFLAPSLGSLAESEALRLTPLLAPTSSNSNAANTPAVTAVNPVATPPAVANDNAAVSLGSGVNLAELTASTASAVTTASPTQVLASSNAATAMPNATNSASLTPNVTNSVAVTPGANAALTKPSVVTQTLAPSTLVPPPADSAVVFTASGETWIELRDANGKVVLQRTMQPGDQAAAGPSTGKIPFSVIVGRANSTQVSVRGKAYDLSAVSSKDNVARFQVK